MNTAKVTGNFTILEKAVKWRAELGAALESKFKDYVHVQAVADGSQVLEAKGLETGQNQYPSFCESEHTP